MPICKIQPLQESHPLASLASNGDHSFSSVASPVGSRECTCRLRGAAAAGPSTGLRRMDDESSLGLPRAGDERVDMAVYCTYLHLLMVNKLTSRLAAPGWHGPFDGSCYFAGPAP